MAERYEVRLTGMDEVLQLLQQLPAEVVSKRGGAVRRAARKGIAVVHRQAKANLVAAIAEPGNTGITRTTGFTEKQLVIKRKAPRGGENGERFIITVNPRPHPSGTTYRRKSRRSATSTRRVRARAAQLVKANDIASFLEWGPAHQPATPWLRPAFAARAPEAIQVASASLLAEVDRLAARYLKR